MHSTEGSRDPAPLDALGGVLVFGASDMPSDGTECSARRKARASSTIAAGRLGRRHQNKNDALRNTNGRQSHEIADPRLVADRRCRAVRDHRADRALDSYFVPLPLCRHTSAGLLAHLLGCPLDPDAERSAQSSGRTSSARLSASRSARRRLRGRGLHGRQDEEEPDQDSGWRSCDQRNVVLRSSEGPPYLPL
jgi:hypothetical protein